MPPRGRRTFVVIRPQQQQRRRRRRQRRLHSVAKRRNSSLAPRTDDTVDRGGRALLAFHARGATQRGLAADHRPGGPPRLTDNRVTPRSRCRGAADLIVRLYQPHPSSCVIANADRSVTPFHSKLLLVTLANS